MASKRLKKQEKEYIKSTPAIILLFNAIGGILVLCGLHRCYYIVASLTGCSFIFLPQFLINKRRYDLCNYYLASVITVFLNIGLSVVYYFIHYSSYQYLLQVIILNSVGVFVYLLGRFNSFKKKV